MAKATKKVSTKGGATSEAKAATQAATKQAPKSTLARVVKRLAADLATLKDAHAFAETVTREFLEERTSSAVTQDVSTGYAAWVHGTYGDDLEKYTQFLEKALEGRKVQGTSLFGWDDPAVTTPSYEADRLLDRIDLGLHFLQRRLKITLPAELRSGPNGPYSIRVGGGKAKDALQRAAAFVDAASDLFAGA